MNRHRRSLLALILLIPSAVGAADNAWRSEDVALAGTWIPVASRQGRVSAWREISLTAPFTLSVESVSVDPGENVTQGQVLARISPWALRARLANVQEAERRADLAHKRLADVQQRLADKLATRNDLLKTESDLSQARAEADTAWRDLQSTQLQLGQPASDESPMKLLARTSLDKLARKWSVVHAPIPAVVAESAVASGSRVSDGALLFRLEDISRVIVAVWVPEQQAAAWQHGKATLDVAGAVPIALKARTDVPELDRQTGLVKLRFEAPNRNQRLLDGQWVTVRREGPPREVVWVPAEAVVSREGKTYCVRHRDDRFQAVEVDAGPEQDGRIPVLTGLHPDDRVVTEGAYLLLYRDLNQLMQFQD